MRVPVPGVDAKYKSLFPGFQQFMVAEEFELGNMLGWEILKIFTEEHNEVEASNEPCTIDDYLTSANDYFYINTEPNPKPKPKPKTVRVKSRAYLVGRKESEIINDMKMDIEAKTSEITRLREYLVVNETEIGELKNEIERLRDNLIRRTAITASRAIVIQDLHNRIYELESCKTGTIFGEAEDASPKIRRIELDD